MKRMLALLLCLLLVATVLAGCGVAKNKKEMAVATDVTPLSFDPVLLREEALVYASHLYEQLLWRGGDDGKTIEAAGAVSWEFTLDPHAGEASTPADDATATDEASATDDATVTDEASATDGASVTAATDAQEAPQVPAYVFTIRASKWSDNKAVRAQDYHYALSRLMNPEHNAAIGWQLARFVHNGEAVMRGEMTVDQLGIAASEDGTKLTIYVAEECPELLVLLTHPRTSPLRQDVVEQNPTTWDRDPEVFVSNGLYMLDSMADGVLTMVPNKNGWSYAHPGNGLSNGVLRWQLTDAVGALTAVEEDTAALALTTLDGGWKPAVDAKLLTTLPQLGIAYIAINNEVAPLDQSFVRRALHLSADPAAALEGLFPGRYMAADRVLGAQLATTGVTGVAPDAQAAKEAWAQAGVSAMPALTLLCDEDVVQFAIAEAIAAQWRETLGIEVSVQKGDPRTSVQQGDYQLAIMALPAYYADAHSLLSPFVTGSVANTVRFANIEYDRYMAEGDYAAAEQLLLAEHALIPLHQLQTELLYKPTVLHGYAFDELGGLRLHHATETREKK